MSRRSRNDSILIFKEILVILLVVHFLFIPHHLLMIIAVGSKNEAKLRAVSKACNKISAMSTLSPWNSNDKVGIMGVNVESGVGDQPMSDSECIEGAITRAKNALEAIENATYGFAIASIR